MARSLTVHHDESPSTNPLFTGFIVFAVAWMLLSGFAATAGVGADAPPVESAPLSNPQ